MQKKLLVMFVLGLVSLSTPALSQTLTCNETFKKALDFMMELPEKERDSYGDRMGNLFVICSEIETRVPDNIRMIYTTIPGDIVIKPRTWNEDHVEPMRAEACMVARETMTGLKKRVVFGVTILIPSATDFLATSDLMKPVLITGIEFYCGG